ncbi:hypothetical protein KIN20_024316 [Parelaphostrongylus tenuis]|uniref:Uncharacterized protein n=1 Tax=Parelaphostrongylus tenuis TaxID=148309 RepID=A0AAD5MT86_PARTN|nr:hypothetical protein KIN20_024316 [Parelaphostrongylus tenuis]
MPEDLFYTAMLFVTTAIYEHDRNESARWKEYVTCVLLTAPSQLSDVLISIFHRSGALNFQPRLELIGQHNPQ